MESLNDLKDGQNQEFVGPFQLVFHHYPTMPSDSCRIVSIKVFFQNIMIHESPLPRT